MNYILIVIFLFLGSSLYSQVLNLEEIRKEKENIEKDIKKIDKQLSEIKNEKANTTNKVSLISRKIVLNETKIKNIESEIKIKEKEIEQKRNQIYINKQQLEILKKDYAKTLNNAYKYINSSSLISYIVSSFDLNQALKRVRYIKEYNNSRKNLYNEIITLNNSIEKQVKKLDDYVDKKERIYLQLMSSKNTTIKEKNNLEKFIRKLRIRERNSLSKLNKKNQEKLKYEKLIKKELKRIEEEKKKRTETEKNSDIILTKRFLENKGQLKFPVDNGVIINSFGKKRHPIHKNVFTENNGVDIITNSNSSIRSIFDGVVSAVIRITGTNKTIIIRHGSYLSVYSNIAVSALVVGQYVQKNQSIGKAEISETKPSIHFEIWENQKPLNPENWINKN